MDAAAALGLLESMEIQRQGWFYWFEGSVRLLRLKIMPLAPNELPASKQLQEFNRVLVESNMIVRRLHLCNVNLSNVLGLGLIENLSYGTLVMEKTKCTALDWDRLAKSANRAEKQLKALRFLRIEDLESRNQGFKRILSGFHGDVEFANIDNLRTSCLMMPFVAGNIVSLNINSYLSLSNEVCLMKGIKESSSIRVLYLKMCLESSQLYSVRKFNSKNNIINASSTNVQDLNKIFIKDYNLPESIQNVQVNLRLFSTPEHRNRFAAILERSSRSLKFVQEGRPNQIARRRRKGQRRRRFVCKVEPSFSLAQRIHEEFQ